MDCVFDAANAGLCTFRHMNFRISRIRHSCVTRSSRIYLRYSLNLRCHIPSSLFFINDDGEWFIVLRIDIGTMILMITRFSIRPSGVPDDGTLYRMLPIDGRSYSYFDNDEIIHTMTGLFNDCCAMLNDRPNITDQRSHGAIGIFEFR